MLNVLKVSTTFSIVHNCHHMNQIKYVHHDCDYVNKKQK
jgi:hypothetical protein